MAATADLLVHTARMLGRFGMTLSGDPATRAHRPCDKRFDPRGRGGIHE